MPERLILGPATALVTPFDSENQLAVKVIPALVKHIFDAGVGGVFVCGWTGEPLSMTKEERMQMAEAVVHESAGQLPVIVHVGATDVETAKGLAKHAVHIKANAIGTTPPLDHVGEIQKVFSYYRQVANAAPDLPFYVYWRDDMKSGDITPKRFLEGMEAIPNFAGIKFTDKDFYFFQQIVDLSGGRLNALTGPDEMFIAGLFMGSDGAIGSTYNIIPRQFVAIYNDFLSNQARPHGMAKQESANRLISALLEKGVLTGIKAILERRGIPVGHVRENIVYKQKGELTTDQVDYLIKVMDENGLS